MKSYRFDIIALQVEANISRIQADEDAKIISSLKKREAIKDKDLMDDTGGKSKGFDKTPKRKPPRDDLKKRWRKRRKTPDQMDLDTDLDPDMRKD